MTYDDFSIEAQKLILEAQRIAYELNHRIIDFEHIIVSAFTMKTDLKYQKILTSSSLVSDLWGFIPSKRSKKIIEKQVLSSRVNKVLSRSKRLALDLDMKYITPEVILCALLDVITREVDILRDYGITKIKLIALIDEKDIYDYKTLNLE